MRVGVYEFEREFDALAAYLKSLPSFPHRQGVGDALSLHACTEQ